MNLKLSLALSLLTISSLDARTWTSAEGRKIEAELVAYDVAANTVRLTKADGKEFTFSLDKLSEEDVSFLKEQEAKKAEQTAALKANAGKLTSHASTGEHKVPFHVRYPNSYDGRARLPMLIVFSPGGGGKGMLTKFIEAADGVNWILVGCDQFKNGMDDELAAKMFAELLPDIEETVSHDPEGLYLGGFSGGAMRSFGFSATVDRPWKGIVSCGGWLGGEEFYGLDFEKKMTVVIINGDKDKAANSWVDRDIGVLKGRRCKVEVFEFLGGHTVAPPETLLKAMQWMESERE